MLVCDDDIVGDQPPGPAPAQARMVSKLDSPDGRQPLFEPHPGWQQPRAYLSGLGKLEAAVSHEQRRPPELEDDRLGVR